MQKSLEEQEKVSVSGIGKELNDKKANGTKVKSLLKAMKKVLNKAPVWNGIRYSR